MKKFKKLIPAMVMLLIATMLMGTTTYAWFSMNTTVTAAGMQIKAEVPTQLLIKGSASGAEYKSAINFTNSADSVQHTANQLISVPPVAYKSSTGAAGVPGTFYKLTANAMSHVKTDGYLREIYNESGTAITSYTDFTKVYLNAAHDDAAFAAATAHTDYLQDDFTLKYAGEYSDSNDDVKVTITVTTTAATTKTDASTLTMSDVSPIYQAVHVVFVQGTNAYEVDLGSATIDTTNSSITSGTATIVFKVADTPLKSFTASNEALAYTLYIFYDGEDAQCINDNAINMQNLNFDLKFELYNAS